jgi:hypothetical protein
METFATALCEVDTLLPFPQVSARFMKMGILSRQVANEHPHDSAEHAKHSRFASTCVWLAQSLRAGGTKAEQAAAFIKSVMPSASYPAPTTSAAAPPRTPVPPVTVASSPEDRAGAEWDEYQQRHGRDRPGMNRANYVTWRVAQMSGKPITLSRRRWRAPAPAARPPPTATRRRNSINAYRRWQRPCRTIKPSRRLSPITLSCTQHTSRRCNPRRASDIPRGIVDERLTQLRNHNHG